MKHLITFFISTLIVIPQVYSMHGQIYWSEHEAQIFKQKKLQEEARKQEALRQQECLRQQQLLETQRQKQIQEEARRQEEARQARLKEEARKQEVFRQQELLRQQQLQEVQRIEQEATVILERMRKEEQEEAQKRIDEETRCLELVRQEEALQLAKMRQLELEKAAEAKSLAQEEYLSQAMRALALEDTPVPVELVASAHNAPLLPTQPHVAQPQDNSDTQAIISDVVSGLVSGAVALSQAAKTVPQPQNGDAIVSLALEIIDGPVTITITPVDQSGNPEASDTKKEVLGEKKDVQVFDGKELKKALALDAKTVQYITQCDWENLFRDNKEEQLIDIFSSLDNKEIEQPDIQTSKYPLHCAAELGFVLLVDTLINQKKVNVNTLNPKTRMNALHYAMLIKGSSDDVNRNCALVADLLIKAEIDTNCTIPRNNATPLYYAAINKRCLAIPILLKGKADMRAVVLTKSRNETTPLEVAKLERNQQTMLPIFTEYARSQAETAKKKA